MTTESTSVPPSPGPWPSAGRGKRPGLASLAPQRAGSDRLALPPRRPAPLRFAAVPLITADVLAVLLAVGLLPEPQRGLRLFLLVAGCVLVLDAAAGLHRPGTSRSARPRRMCAGS
ncbi:hypothetical protein [Streptomyces sp. NPDC047981]|uniref:hypothetical protein n=1 Tax=Streptomyces sp. NPDC047981 TaxID=3154610 RepID=UPI003449B609